MDVLHNEALLAAIERMNKVNDRASREAVLDLVISQAQFISPVEILPGEVWCTKFTYETIPDQESFFEAHEKFLDIHMMLSGSERVEISAPADLEQFRSEPQNDFFAYRGEGYHKLVLAPGDFLVVWPQDAHKIKMQLGEPETVTKAVFKIKIR